MPNFMIARFQTSEITWRRQTNRQTDKQTDKAIYIVDLGDIYLLSIDGSINMICIFVYL